MSIPDPTIDPVTGLPLVSLSSVIQQIPLGADVFPFADYRASSQPARGPIYGDDIIPTSALVAGQHPTLANAQSVRTDGAHALLVKDVGGSGGGLGKVSTSRYQQWFTNLLVFNGVQTNNWPNAPIKTLYGVSISCHIDPTVGFMTGNFTFEMVYHPTIITVYGATLDLSGTGTSGVGMAAVTQNLLLPLPLDLSGYEQVTTGFFQAYIAGTANQAYMTVGLVYD